jgi:hypothetical protein
MELEPGLSRYGVGGRSGLTAATIDFVIGALWNPHASKAITIRLMTVSKLAGPTGQRVRRVTVRGTPASTVTPGIENDFERLAAPASGTVLDLGDYSVQPTLMPPDMWRGMPSVATAVPGAIEEIYFGDRGLRLPATTGLAWSQTAATSSQFDISFVWDE